MRQVLRLSVMALVLACSAIGAGAAQERLCSPDSLSALVDATAGAIRDLNAKSERDYAQRLNSVARQKGWDENERRRHATLDYDDPKLNEFNSEIETLFSRIDELSRPEGGSVSCEQVEALKTVRDKLLVVMGQKSGYMLAQLEAAPPARIAAAPAAPSKTVEPAAPQAKPNPAPKPAPKGDAAPPTRWSAEVDRAPLAPFDTSLADELPVQLIPSAPDEGYTIEEIREAGRGLFGTLSAEFAGVLNAIFKTYGKPNGYITGREGGGAFLAGLRFGKGKLHRKLDDKRPVFWQGPSIGYDFGAEGSSVIFLVYNLKQPDDIFGRFSGISGQAYVAGGVGFTALTNGKIVILPVRVGIGLRIGASLTYLKMTDKRTWNPF